MDWEYYNYLQDPAAGGGQPGNLENPLAALLAGIPDFSTEEFEALLRTCQFLTIQGNLPRLAMAEAVEVSDTL